MVQRYQLNVVPASAAPDAIVPDARTAPKEGQRLTRRALSELCRTLLERVAEARYASEAFYRAARTLNAWLSSRSGALGNGDWARQGRRLVRYFLALSKGESVRPAFAVFTTGNKKLPFPAFSTLPVFSCPGAGECARWCYSFHGWRNPGTFYRQLQNTLLLRLSPDVVRAAFLALPAGSTVRLYVDGDLDSLDSIRFWMECLSERPDVSAYGYSKSWDLLLAYHRGGGLWASNYVLNLSGGGQSYATEEEMNALPITRGPFVTLNVRVPKGEGRYRDRGYRAALKAAATAAGMTRHFLCPGECGSCSSRGPVCGMKGADLPVVIGTH